MVLAKNDLFDETEQQCALMFKALAHPARVRIVRYLASAKCCISGDISNELPLSRTTVNQHLRELKKAGLIQGHIEGKNTNYCLNYERVEELKVAMQTLMDEMVRRNDFTCSI